MTRPVPFDTLEAREKAARDRLNRERRTVARLKREAAQTQADARMARLCALGETVEEVCGSITPAHLKALLSRLESYGFSGPKIALCVTSFPLGETTKPQEFPPEVSATPRAFRQQPDMALPDKPLMERA